MPNVIPFRPDRRPRSERPSAGESAAILFFTGVRYERFAEVEDAADAAMLMMALQAEQDAALAPEERLQA